MTAGKKIIGCIGTGNMGSAIMLRLATNLDPALLRIYDKDTTRTEALSRGTGIKVSPTPKALTGESGVIIIAVKPDTVASVIEQIRDALQYGAILVSIAAGVSIAAIEVLAGSPVKIVRVMPNTPCMVGEGMSVLSLNEHVDEQSLLEVEQIFSKIGKVVVLPEKLMDAVTGLSGSGPAYVFTFIQALADGGVKLGIPRDKAVMLAAQTVLGSAKYVLESGEDPATLRARVTSPGGTTIEGIHVLERSGFSGIVMDAVEKAAQKSQKLGER